MQQNLVKVNLTKNPVFLTFLATEFANEDRAFSELDMNDYATPKIYYCSKDLSKIGGWLVVADRS